MDNKLQNISEIASESGRQKSNHRTKSKAGITEEINCLNLLC